MTHTEAEARKKWCPFTGSRHERMDNNGEWRVFLTRDCKCIVSDCMAWRLSAATSQLESELDLGYCGLAGEPE